METDSFLMYLRDVKRYSQHTITAYAEDLNQFIEFSEKYELIHEWTEVSSGMIRRFEAGLMAGTLSFSKGGDEIRIKPLSAKSVARKLSSLRSLFRYLLREGKVKDNPLEVVPVPKIGKKLPVFVPDDDMNELLDANFDYSDFASFRDMMILKMAYCTGMRRSELVGLKVADIDGSSRVIKIRGKGNKERLVPMLDELVADVDRYLQERQKVVGRSVTHNSFFVTDAGNPVNDMYVHRHVSKYLEKVKTLSRHSPHVLRHSFATALLNNGAGIEAIRELLGHSNLAATQVYTHNSFESLKRVYNKAHPRA